MVCCAGKPGTSTSAPAWTTDDHAWQQPNDAPAAEVHTVPNFELAFLSFLSQTVPGALIIKRSPDEISLYRTFGGLSVERRSSGTSLSGRFGGGSSLDRAHGRFGWLGGAFASYRLLAKLREIG